MAEVAHGGQRRPQDDDLQPILDLIWDGRSLRATCRELGLHTPSTSDWLHAERPRREQYARAREGRAEHLQEDALEFGRAAATGQALKIGADEVTIDAAGYRAYLDGIKWATARMAPKTAPVERHDHRHEFGSLSDEELDRRIAAREAVLTSGSAFADDDDV